MKSETEVFINRIHLMCRETEVQMYKKTEVVKEILCTKGATYSSMEK